MSTENTKSWYDAAFTDFLSRINQVESTKKYFQQLSSQFKEARSLVSIGPARGVIDSEVLSSLPRCRSYFGAEPQKVCAEELELKIKQDYPNIEVHIINSSVEEWDGPPRPVDMVFVSHVYYYFQNRKDVTLKLLSWINPGGFLFICHAGAHYSAKMIRDLGLSGAIEDHAYLQDDLKKELKELDVNIAIEDAIEIETDLRRKTNDIANFYRQKECTKDEAQELFAYLDQEYPSGIEKHHNWMTIIEKK